MGTQEQYKQKKKNKIRSFSKYLITRLLNKFVVDCPKRFRSTKIYLLMNNNEFNERM